MTGRLEETILRTVVGVGGESYGAEIHQYILKRMHCDYSPGAILTTLYRLEENGFVTAGYSDPLPQRGGRRRRMFKIEAAGIKALRETDLANARIAKLFPLAQCSTT
jgi:PadR family transcriptional regulator, regulatory protein PadR